MAYMLEYINWTQVLKKYLTKSSPQQWNTSLTCLLNQQNGRHVCISHKLNIWIVIAPLIRKPMIIPVLPYPPNGLNNSQCHTLKISSIMLMSFFSSTNHSKYVTILFLLLLSFILTLCWFACNTLSKNPNNILKKSHIDIFQKKHF